MKSQTTPPVMLIGLSLVLSIVAVVSVCLFYSAEAIPVAVLIALFTLIPIVGWVYARHRIDDAMAPHFGFVLGTLPLALLLILEAVHVRNGGSVDEEVVIEILQLVGKTYAVACGSAYAMLAWLQHNDRSRKN